MPISADDLAFFLLVAGGAFAALNALGPWLRPRGRRAWSPDVRNPRPLRIVPPPAPGAPDAADQLRAVIGAGFTARPLLNRTEAKVFEAAEAAVRAQGLNWRVMAQVCLGEILATPDEAAFRAVNSKRVDILLVARDGAPIAAVEVQGAGHYQGAAPARDAVKREALRQAGVRFIEITPDDPPDQVAREIARLAQGRTGRVKQPA